MKLKEIINKFKNSKYKKEIITITIILFLITVVVTLRGTHAYYNYESGWVPIFNSKVGNFAGKGDTSPLNQPSDVNLLFLVQDITNPRKYTIMEGTPVAVSGYQVNNDKSNCIPTDGTYQKYGENVYSISSDGTVTVKVSETQPKQIVCRIYYDYEKDLTKDDVIVFALKEDPLGMVIYNNKHYVMSEEIPSTGYTYNSSSCKNTDIATEIGYNVETGFTFKTKGPNICYAYFNIG